MFSSQIPSIWVEVFELIQGSSSDDFSINLLKLTLSLTYNNHVLYQKVRQSYRFRLSDDNKVWFLELCTFFTLTLPETLEVISLNIKYSMYSNWCQLKLQGSIYAPLVTVKWNQNQLRTQSCSIIRITEELLYISLAIYYTYNVTTIVLKHQKKNNNLW